MIDLRHGDSLEILPELIGEEKQYDLIVFDPPSELTFEQTVEALDHTYYLGRNLIWYGRNKTNMWERIFKSNWTHRNFSCRSIFENCLFVGNVLDSRKPSQWNRIDVQNTKGTNKLLFSSKEKDWFYPTIINVPFKLPESILDPFAGLGALGEICKEYGIDYTAIELDETYFNYLENRLLND